MEKASIYKKMKRFYVDISVEGGCELCVWGESKEDVEETFNNYTLGEIEERGDIDIRVRCSEDPSISDAGMDGIVEPEGQFKDGFTTFVDDDGNTCIPTDNEALFSPSIQAILEAERNGAQPLPGFSTLHSALGLNLKKGVK